MLTDLHVHLRPDDPGTDAERYFTAANAERYLAAADQAGIAELGIAEHVYRFTAALDIWRHPLWESSAVDDLDAYADFVRQAGLRLGIEADFVPGREDQIANLLDRLEPDYVIGSVHFLGERAVDQPGFDIWEGSPSPDFVWRRYFETLAEAARSGLFDVLAHPDLVKVWGRARPAPERDRRFFYEPAVEAVAETGVAVEVSTAGLRKPAGELYPSDELAEMLVDAGAVFSLSSDAHRPEEVGYEYSRALEAMAGWGVTEVAVFEHRERCLESLG
ncbi:MAG: histidinol-phosphatase [Solirubrobacterales bacterium]|nr:histidinol-phosphatase [Solirubrobacterales bacterium]